MAVCIFNKVFTIKALEVGLIFTIFFVLPAVFSAPTPRNMDTIEMKLHNPCGYRTEHTRHSRSAKEKQVEEQFKLFKHDYRTQWDPRIKALYSVATNLSLKFSVDLPKKAVKNKKKTYEHLQVYTKLFDTLAKQNHIVTAGNFTLKERKDIFEALTASSIRLLCVMYDEQKKHPKLKPRVKDLDKRLSVPQDFTQLYAQDYVLLHNFDKFLKTMDRVIPYPKNNKKKKNQKQTTVKTVKNQSVTPRTKNPTQKNKRKNPKVTS